MSPTMAALTGTICRDAAAPLTRRIVSAASGPYEADASASNPSTGIPCAGPICCSASASERKGFPKRSVRRLIIGTQQVFCPRSENGVRDRAGSAEYEDRTSVASARRTKLTGLGLVVVDLAGRRGCGRGVRVDGLVQKQAVGEEFVRRFVG